MIKERLWTRDFMALVLANGFLFAGFHFLLPTITLYAASLGATGGEIGLIGGIFGYSAICIRLFTDTGVHYLGKKKCLYLGLALSILATVSYYMFDSIHAIVAARILHGFGFGLSTTFAAAIVADVIPASRRGEGIGYFGLGSTVMMALAPAVGLFLLNDISPAALFFASAAVSFLAVLASVFCHAGKKVRRVEVKEKASLRDRICETGTGLPAVLTIFFGAAYGSVNTYIAMMAAEAHIENAGLFFIIGTLFVFISRPFGGRLLDAKGAFAVVMPGSVLYLIGLLLIMAAHSLTVLLAASVFYGLGAGLLLPALLTWILNMVRPERRSSASATFYNMLDIGTSTGILVLGVIAGMVGYRHMYWSVTALMICFAVLFMFCNYRYGSDVMASQKAGKGAVADIHED